MGHTMARYIITTKLCISFPFFIYLIIYALASMFKINFVLKKLCTCNGLIVLWYKNGHPKTPLPPQTYVKHPDEWKNGTSR